MTDSESDDSDAEGGLGNVSRVVMRPPGHSGKAKKGHLCFDASFETGNLGKIDLISDFEYDLYIRPDTCNPYHRMWFNFVVDNTKLDQRVMFNIVNISKHLNLFCYGMTPIVKSGSRKKWHRMPPHQVYFYQSPLHNDNYVLTLSFCFDKEEEAYQFAYSYPYSYSKCQAYLELVEKRMLLHFKRESIGSSLQKRRIDMVTITSPMNMEIKTKLKMVVIFSRLHPGDSPTSYICQGIIDFLISNHPMIKKLRNRVVFKIIPMVNPDGVVLGNFRSNLLGADFNRCWNRISHWSHPPLYAIFNTISKFNEDTNIELDFVIDLRSHCTLTGVFVHGNTYDNVYRLIYDFLNNLSRKGVNDEFVKYERHTLFSKLLSQNVEGYEPTYCMFNRDNRRKGSCRRFFSTIKDSVNSYSIFVSFYGYTHKKTKKLIYFTEESYRCIGRNIVRTFSDYYTYVGLLAKKATKKNADKTTRKRRRKFGNRVAFSKIKKRKLGKRRRCRRNETRNISRITKRDSRCRLNLEKNLVDFSNVVFPPIESNKKIRSNENYITSKSKNHQ